MGAGCGYTMVENRDQHVVWLEIDPENEFDYRDMANSIACELRAWDDLNATGSGDAVEFDLHFDTVDEQGASYRQCFPCEVRFAEAIDGEGLLIDVVSTAIGDCLDWYENGVDAVTNKYREIVNYLHGKGWRFRIASTGFTSKQFTGF